MPPLLIDRVFGDLGMYKHFPRDTPIHVGFDGKLFGLTIAKLRKDFANFKGVHCFALGSFTNSRRVCSYIKYADKKDFHQKLSNLEHAMSQVSRAVAQWYTPRMDAVDGLCRRNLSSFVP